MSLGSDTYDEAEGFQLRDEQRMGKGLAATDAARFYSAGRPILYRPDPNAGGPKPGTETEADARADVDRLLAPKRLHDDGLVNEKYVTALLAEHRAGRANHAKPLWALVMLQYWLETWA